MGEDAAIVAMDAVALAEAIRDGGLSCAEVMAAFLDRIDDVNPKVNAIVALRPRDELMAEAVGADAARARGDHLGPLHGLPHAVKDLEPVAGLPFTMGSPIFRDHIAPADGIMAARLRAAGAIFIGKTNAPEFGFGSHTYNPVYGVTHNPYDLTRTAGGSSGGAAVTLACRMVPLADGGDFGGSLRNPAGWNNLFALRPSIGRVPADALDKWLPSMSVLGPMARSIDDLALLFSVQAGYDPRAPLSLGGDGSEFVPTIAAKTKGARIGWLGDFAGFSPCEPELLEVCRTALGAFERLGFEVEAAAPDYPVERAWEALLILRAWTAGARVIAHYNQPAERVLLKPEAVFEAESGLKLTAYDITKASVMRSQWTSAVTALFERFDYLAAPTAALFPFPVEWDWPHAIAGRPMATYHEWMKLAFLITLTGLPVLAAPAGFSSTGLPIGLQIVGPNRSERDLLVLGQAYDEATGWVRRRPPPLSD
jgi:amidase